MASSEPMSWKVPATWRSGRTTTVRGRTKLVAMP
ncbi:MAG: hypothetical protein BJ554DRAFT_3566 [Olpidium bornovanus]|uniref:Uncharacterized protein n=1 Tax=Olpidium bornovanus TaxID=278681 RepID=A0A8H8DFQ5_9FUNG|nr:MAG: hypothetical protein BJ554DRAFT_3566 [Olpidium bornovanus]